MSIKNLNQKLNDLRRKYGLHNISYRNIEFVKLITDVRKLNEELAPLIYELAKDLTDINGAKGSPHVEILDYRTEGNDIVIETTTWNYRLEEDFKNQFTFPLECLFDEKALEIQLKKIQELRDLRNAEIQARMQQAEEAQKEERRKLYEKLKKEFEE